MKLLLVSLTVFFSLSLHSQGWMSQGARTGALANNGVVFEDVFAFHHNPGALGFLTKGSVGLTYESRYALKELQTQSVAAAMPLKTGVISVGGQFYGYDAYRTTRAGAGYSMKLTNFLSAGVQLNYLGMQLGDFYGSKHGISAEFGALAKVGNNVNVGFSVVNLTRSKLADFRDERFGTLMRLGASYQIIEQLLIMAEFEQEIGFDTRMRAGIEYLPIEKLSIRAGVQGGPMDFAFGLGLNLKRFRLDLGTQYNQRLGWSPAVSFIVDFYAPK